MKSFFFCCLALSVTLPVSADEIIRITPDGSLGNVAFRNLAMNANGDYLAVSVSNVYAGDANSNELKMLYDGDRESFSLGYSGFYNIRTNDTNPDCDRFVRVTLDVELHQMKAAINDHGDFVLASVTKVFVGNVRTPEIRQVFAGSNSTEFQSVAINNSGHYLVASYRNVYGGHVAEAAPTHLVDSALGSLGIVTAGDSFQTINVEVKSPRLALNTNGQFVVLTSQEVYSGSIAEGRVERLLADPGIGFEHVQLNESGKFVVSSKRNLFRGTID